MIILTLLAVLISGGKIPVFIALLAVYDVLIAAFIARRKILNLFKVKTDEEKNGGFYYE